MKYKAVIEKWNELDELLKVLELKDSSTPGLRREIQVADILGHDVHKTKHGPDAHSRIDENEKYEYLCSAEEGSVQLDRIDLTNVHERIGKSNKVFAIFFKENVVSKIYEIDSQSVLVSAVEKINRGIERSRLKNKEWTSKHIGWTESEIVSLNARKIYEKKGGDISISPTVNVNPSNFLEVSHTCCQQTVLGS